MQVDESKASWAKRTVSEYHDNALYYFYKDRSKAKGSAIHLLMKLVKEDEWYDRAQDFLRRHDLWNDPAAKTEPTDKELEGASTFVRAYEEAKDSPGFLSEVLEIHCQNIYQVAKDLVSEGFYRKWD